ncbi:U-box domain-containing protein 36 [Bienertia sinuspersici]
MENKEVYDDNGEQTLEFQVPTPCSREISKVVPEIIEIEEEEDDDKNVEGVSKERRENNNNTRSNRDVYVAVGKDDLVVLKWVLAHAVVPVGRLWVGQLSPEQAKVYAIEEHTKRKNLLHKYIRLCVESKVSVDTILIESSETTKAISDIISVLNLTSLVMGTKHSPSSRRLIKGSNKGTSIQKMHPIIVKLPLFIQERSM